MLLALAGAFKVARPGTGSGRWLGGAELVTGLGALIFGTSVWAWAVAALYLGFAAFVVRSMVRGSTAGCGCFGGADDAPPGA
ncbi:MAG: MauE/DoxX family redox-associated membrane protein, partial [Acidimicrobiales bacterium]